jgi:hypothetical protein
MQRCTTKDVKRRLQLAKLMPDLERANPSDETDRASSGREWKRKLRGKFLGLFT